MGGGRGARTHHPPAEVAELAHSFHQVASQGTPEEALAAFYAYESQVPRLAQEKARGLEQRYGADEKTRGYFTLHATADLYHARLWRQQLGKRIEANPEAAGKALTAGENAARALWRALDGIEARRMAPAN
jgi:pyrroloquinoline-quinone synthase